MLMLTRRVGETIVIGKDIRLTITAVNGNQVRLGIDAPKNIAVDREEIRDRKDSGLPPPLTHKLGEHL